MVKSVTANYKLAVPQYYKGNIQLLLPVCLLEPMKADVALVVTKSNDIFKKISVKVISSKSSKQTSNTVCFTLYDNLLIFYCQCKLTLYPTRGKEMPLY